MSDGAIEKLPSGDNPIAIVGMAGRFPNAPDIDRFWAACRDGDSCISRWESATNNERVNAGGLVIGQDMFDPEAFGMSPADTEILDPQHRVFLEVCWHALADAAVVPNRSTPVSVYAAAAPSRYRPKIETDDENSRYRLMIANAPDYLATRVAYYLNLGGEAITVQTACSSSLVAVHLACQSLHAGRCDVALAGGVSIDPDQEYGYRYQDGMIASPDGCCLPFDVEARGAVPGNGGAVVALQRLSDAIAQGRRIHGIILATAVNNDGRGKSSFMAPNVEGQSEAIATALALAGVPADTIGYLETHGTATRLGDAIEIEAAGRAFGWFTDRQSFCALGSLKANFGHLDRAAGVSGLIKAVLTVREGIIPPLHGFNVANPDLGIEASPFRVPKYAEPWPSGAPRRASVSSFGVGGTNAHVIVEAPPILPERSIRKHAPADEVLALPLSTHSRESLMQGAGDLARELDGDVLDFRDMANTLATGRPALPVRSVVVTSRDRAAAALRDLLPLAAPATAERAIAMVFPGQGAEVGYRARALLERFQVFRTEIEAFAQSLEVEADQLLAGVDGTAPEHRAFAFQPSLVAVQVGLAQLAKEMGLVPMAVCGNSLGEYAAAYLAGVFDRRGLMKVLVARDRLMREAPEGRMLAVLAPTEKVESMRLPEVDLAGENWRDRILFSGRPDAIDRQLALFEQQGIMARILPGRIGPHGRLMEPIADKFREALESVALSPAELPIFSSLSGDQEAPGALAETEHWVRHLCEPFRFRSAFKAMRKAGLDLFVEASPGMALTKILRTSNAPVIATSLGGEADTDSVAAFLSALGEAWCAGASVDWQVANGVKDAQFATLPPYPFQRRRYWNHADEVSDKTKLDLENGLIEHPVWRPYPAEAKVDSFASRPVIVHGSGPFAEALITRLYRAGIQALRADTIDQIDGGALLIDVSGLDSSKSRPMEPSDKATLMQWLERGLLDSAAFVERLRPRKLVIATRGLFAVTPGDVPATAQTAAVGLARCAPHDWPGMQARIVDFSLTESDGDVDNLFDEISISEGEDVAYREGVRYQRRWEPLQSGSSGRLLEGGIYLVLGGTGRLGAVVAEAISREVNATIVLVGRSAGRESSAARRLIDTATARGSTVVNRTAHVDEGGELAALLDACFVKWGRIDGVFHLAANTDTDSFQFLGEATAQVAHEVARAKVCTAALLAEHLAERNCGFVALFSSISTVIGAARFATYVAANAYLDALAQRLCKQSENPWISIVWDAWAADGSPAEVALGFEDGASLLLRAICADEAVVAPVLSRLDARRAAVTADLALVAQAGDTASKRQNEGTVAERVGRVVADVTGYDVVDPHQKLASLGIDSLQMMQIAVRLRSLLGLHSGIGKLLAATSVNDLTALAEVVDDQPADLPREGDAESLSTPQQRLWYLTELDSESSNYNVPFGWLVPAAASVVRSAVDALLERHELLRTAYRVGRGGEPRRVAMCRSDVPVQEVNLDPIDPDGGFFQIARAIIETPFDLAAGSTRVLIAAGPEGTRLVFVCHHLSIDAWSIKRLRDELTVLLEGDEPLGMLGAGYDDFVSFEHERRTGPEYEELAAWWRDVLHDVVPTLPPADPDMTPTGECPVGRAVVHVDVGRLVALRSMLRERGTTLYVAGLTALSLSLCHWCSTSEVTIGTNLANRMHEALEPVVGMFVDPVVLRLAPGLDDPDATLGEALDRVRERFAAAIAHTGIPYLDIVHACDRQGTAGDNPLFSIMATMFDTEQGMSQLVSLDLPLPERAKFALALEFLPRPDGLMIHALYDADRYRSVTIERHIGTIRHVLEAMADGCNDATLASILAGLEGVSTRERFARRFDRVRGPRSRNPD